MENANLPVVSPLANHERLEEVLWESEAGYRDFQDLIENAHDLIQSVALDGRFLFVNRAWLDTLGYTQADLRDLTLFDIIHPDSRSHCQVLFSKILAGQACPKAQATFVTKDGRAIAVEGNVTGRYQGRQVIATHGFFRDITARKHGEEALRKTKAELEQRVCERTAELEKVNATLKAEVASHKRTENALQESGAHLRNILNSLPSFIGLLTPEGRLAEVNQTALDMAALSPETEGGKPFEETYWWAYAPAVQAQLRAAIQQAAQGEVVRYDVPMRVGADRFLVVDFSLTPVRNSEGQVTHLVPSAVDITERKHAEEMLQKAHNELEQRVQERTAELAAANSRLTAEIAERQQAEEALQASEEKFSKAFRASPVPLSLSSSTDGRYIEINDSFCQATGYRREELVGHTSTELNVWPNPEDRAKVLNTLQQQGAVRGLETQFQKKSGELGTILLSLESITLGDEPCLLGVSNDITERKRAEAMLQKAYSELELRVQARTAELTHTNAQLQVEIAEREQAEEQVRASLQEKEVLLKEIHHRVKNNLQVISSLLYLQADQVPESQALQVFEDSQHRIRSMALVHEKLYQAQDLSQVDFREYVCSLIGYLFQCYGLSEARIALKIGTERVLLRVDKAIPCGLILNELVSNALTHAFPHGRTGTLGIDLQAETDGQVLLRVRDDGVGFPHEVDFRHTSSLGLQLVQTLTKQLRGTIALHTKSGTAFELRFPV